MIKSRTEASRMVRGGRQSTVRGALYESTSIAAVYGTICSLVWGTMGAALNLGTRVPGNLGGNRFSPFKCSDFQFQLKVSFVSVFILRDQILIRITDAD